MSRRNCGEQTMRKLTEKECDWLKRIEREIDKVWDDLTAWEQRFMEDLLERFRQYGARTQISAKQWAIITRISEKII